MSQESIGLLRMAIVTRPLEIRIFCLIRASVGGDNTSSDVPWPD